MDPHANMKEQQELAENIRAIADSDDDYNLNEYVNDAARLAELVLALLGWIKNGGDATQHI